MKFGFLFGTTIRLYSYTFIQSHELCQDTFHAERPFGWQDRRETAFTDGRNLKQIPAAICSSWTTLGKGSVFVKDLEGSPLVPNKQWKN